jgi:hydrogenase maturation protein HypF
MDKKPDPTAVEAQRIIVGGRVQGVGFRPFVYRLAHAHGIDGSVRNLTGQVEILAQGPADSLAHFAHALVHTAPPLARPEIVSTHAATPTDATGFTILASERGAQPQIHVPPDFFACDACVRELLDPDDRRFRYPFINCTQCGPRYTLITRLPYDRPNTTMADFALCPACRAEYDDPLDRRFHAEPVACPVCGPQLAWRDTTGHDAAGEAALSVCVSALRAGRIVAVKGVGGYHLMCDARSDAAVAALRARKPRPHKPLAVMLPVRGRDSLDAVRREAVLTPAHEALLRDPMRPIVLVAKRADATLSAQIAPGLNEVGVFLPYSPLHHLLLDAFDAPLVATSANVSGEPVLTDNAEVEARLAHVAGAFLHHNRPIARPADDPVFRVIADTPRPLRLGRGVAPLELTLPVRVPQSLLAVGGHMKNTVALAWGERVVVSPHIGDLDAPRSLAVFAQVIADLQALYGVRATHIVHDAHPGYASTRWAKQAGLPVRSVFHHHAHASALAGEYREVKRWLVFTWDGVGYGEDGTLWGGEALLGAPGAWRRVASFRPFHLPGGERAGREPWRSALALTWEAGVTWRACAQDTQLLHQAWTRRINAPPSSAVGRLFDAAAALTGINTRSSFEGQGPMLLESAVAGAGEALALPLAPDAHGLWRSDWAPLLAPLLDDSRTPGERAALFHASLAQALVDQALRVRAGHGEFTVGLAGGVFQNRVLTELALARLARHGFATHLGARLPANDAAIAYGQVIEAAHTPP